MNDKLLNINTENNLLTIDKQLLNDNINNQNYQGNTLLHKMVSNNQTPELINKLIKFGADPNIKNIFGQTPLHISKNIIISKILIENDANPFLKDLKNYKPFDIPEIKELIMKKYFKLHYNNKKPNSINKIAIFKKKKATGIKSDNIKSDINYSNLGLLNSEIKINKKMKNKKKRK